MTSQQKRLTQEAVVDSSRSRYERWLLRMHRPAHARRTADRNAAFFLPHLRPGMRLLDAGCGAGSITLGLEEAVAGGNAVGIDASNEAIASARATASSLAHHNLRFATGDMTALPFADVSFDAVFCHAVLQHLRDPLSALRELRRVLSPGGIIGAADADIDGSIIAPADPTLDASARLLQDLRAQTTGGDLRIGKHLRRLLHEAGFEHVVSSVRADSDGDAESVRRTGIFWATYYRAPELKDYAIDLALATESQLDAMSDAWLRWSESPGAFWARFWCQAVAWAG
jgi:ubiquinone/menaquinone biosynthesis C-methylase UbiE